MGNSSSGQGTVDETIPSPIVGGGPGRIKSKVLPDLTPALRLRQTDNGAILHNGGTISTRKQDRYKQGFDDNNRIEIKRDFYGSEPDLRYQGRLANFNNDSPSKIRISRSKKKYKAPTVPNNNQIPGDSSSPDSFQEWENSINAQPSRRLRLFKTKAQTRKKNSDNLPSLHSYLPPAGTLQRSLSTPQFHAELIEATDKLRTSKAAPSISPVGGYRSLDTEKEKLIYGRNHEENMYSNMPFQKAQNQRIKAESGNDRPSPSHEIWQKPPLKAQGPVKTFYFGMNANGEINESTALDKFAEKINHLSAVPVDADRSDYSPEIFDDIISNESKGNISVQLRATLPRKQLDIPRFSPTTAWRMLSNLDSPPPSEDDDVLQFEHRLLAPPLPVLVPVQMDKSADSGISGDASPQHHDSTHDSQVAWTPQQDLEETSSDGGFPCQPLSPDCSTAKFSPRFTLSLPRDDRMTLYGSGDKDTGEGHSLMDTKKMRRCGSGVFGKSCLDKDENGGDESPLLDSNWLLSRSVPNSLNYANVNFSKWNDNVAEIPDEQEDDIASSLIKQPSFSYLQNGGHIMYLPEYTKPRGACETPNYPMMSHTVTSKSCEDLSHAANYEPVSVNNSESLEPIKISKGKKFTFQSTVRQIERKRLAEKLSKQVEHKEKERRSELEAMRKVEEEFQRKREREKADIRQQLRLYTITQNSKVNSQDLLSTQVLSEFRQQHREYKEYRSQRRPLNDMESAPCSDNNAVRATVHPKIVCQIPKTAQVYVTPRTLGGQSDNDYSEQVLTKTTTADNYRKNFAQGGLPNSLSNSESEMAAGQLHRNRSLITSNHKENKMRGRGEEKEEEEEEESIISIERPKITLGITETKIIMLPQDKTTKSMLKKDIDISCKPKQLNQQVPSNAPLLGVSALKPFVRGKTYKPISFNPGGNQVAQFAN